MTLTEQLAEANKANREKIPNDVLKVMDKAITDLKAVHLAEKTLKIGDVFPDVTLPNAKTNSKRIYDLKGDKATIISFYRGGWCPYCNIQLKALQNNLSEFNKLGASLITITPETPDNSLTTSEKNELSFEVLSDINNSFAKKLGLVFKLPEDLQAIYSNFGLDIKKHNQNEDYELPLAATFILDTNNTVIYTFVNEDYTKRADINEILSTLKSI